MKTKWISFLLTLVIALNAQSIIHSKINHFALSTLLDSDLQIEKNNNLTKLLLNATTNNKQTDQPTGEQLQTEQTFDNNRAGLILNNETTNSIGENGIITQKESAPVTQYLQNSTLVDRIFPMILEKLQPKVTAVEKTIDTPAIFTGEKSFNIGCPDNAGVVGGGYVLDDTSFLGVRESAPHLDPQGNVIEWTVTIHSQALVMNNIAGSDIRGPDYAKILAPLKIYAICLEFGGSTGPEKPIKLN